MKLRTILRRITTGLFSVSAVSAALTGLMPLIIATIITFLVLVPLTFQTNHVKHPKLTPRDYYKCNFFKKVAYEPLRKNKRSRKLAAVLG